MNEITKAKGTTGMEAANPHEIFRILCECYARANGLIVESITFGEESVEDQEEKEL